MFVARTMKIMFKSVEKVHLRKYKTNYILTVFLWVSAQNTVESV
jgi:hypothetical protein